MTNADRKAAVRERMARTGENYTTALRAVKEEAAARRAIPDAKEPGTPGEGEENGKEKGA